jgi:radical SAM superfamily enzyme YgiQ (UPF0313 family)
MHYTPHVDHAFDSVERIMRDVNHGWLLRYVHANGAAMFFLVVYIHIFRGLSDGSSIEETIRFAREMNPETLQVSLASPYPGTHFYQYVQDNGFLVQSVYNDEAGYQKCTVTYPGLGSQEMFDAVERFYRKYYFRPSYVFKSVKKMIRSSSERKRLWREAGDFFSAMRERRSQSRSHVAQ